MKITEPTGNDSKLPTDNLANFLHHLNYVRRGIHPNFKGDGVYNGEGLLSRFCADHPKQALAFAAQLDKSSKEDLVVINDNFHITRIRGFSKTIKRTVDHSI